MSVYLYYISDDTLNAAVDSPKLTTEIEASSIVAALDRIDTDGDTLYVVFDATLSTGEQTTLDGLIGAHDGVPVVVPDDPTIVRFEHTTPVQDIPKVSIYPAEGSSATIVSHDWSDPCTWYYDSQRVTGETASLVSGKTYSLANSNIIDLTHGRMYGEDEFAASYSLEVYDNSVLKVEGTDYTMNYEDGEITFDAGYTVTGPVTCDYSYEDGSTWVVGPTSGKVLHLEHAEVQFSKDVSMSPISFEIWVYNPFDLPNKVKYQGIKYKNIKDMINAANLGQGFIPAMGGLTHDVLVFPFNYATIKSLKHTDGAELRVKIDNDVAFTGEFATATFYVLSEDI